MSGGRGISRVHLRLPATSANLGPGFDTLALALKLYLTIDAEPAAEFTIEATGRNADLCGSTENNLLIDTYRALLEANTRSLVPLRLRMHNEIPLGMGCGSSAAVRLAACALASQFGGLAWDRPRVLAEANRLEGHPDNVSGCWLGGFVASACFGDGVQAVSFSPPPQWRAVLVMPDRPLATTASRAILPEVWARRDVIANLQRLALLTAAFATGNAALFANATRDWLHQPYRAEVCPMLGALLPLAGSDGVAGVALSGAGPAVLLLTASEQEASTAVLRAREAVGNTCDPEILVCELATDAAEFLVQSDSAPGD